MLSARRHDSCQSVTEDWEGPQKNNFDRVEINVYITQNHYHFVNK